MDHWLMYLLFVLSVLNSNSLALHQNYLFISFPVLILKKRGIPVLILARCEVLKTYADYLTLTHVYICKIFIELYLHLKRYNVHFKTLDLGLI